MRTTEGFIIAAMDRKVESTTLFKISGLGAEMVTTMEDQTAKKMKCYMEAGIKAFNRLARFRPKLEEGLGVHQHCRVRRHVRRYSGSTLDT